MPAADDPPERTSRNRYPSQAPTFARDPSCGTAASALSAGGVEVVTVSEEAIVAAAGFHLFRMKHLVEPSGATGLAAIRELGAEVAGKRVGVIVSGGNTDLAWLER